MTDINKSKSIRLHELHLNWHHGSLYNFLWDLSKTTSNPLFQGLHIVCHPVSFINPCRQQPEEVLHRLALWYLGWAILLTDIINPISVKVISRNSSIMSAGLVWPKDIPSLRIVCVEVWYQLSI